jgi:hypothetical protein
MVIFQLRIVSLPEGINKKNHPGQGRILRELGIMLEIMGLGSNHPNNRCRNETGLIPLATGAHGDGDGIRFTTIYGGYSTQQLGIYPTYEVKMWI